MGENTLLARIGANRNDLAGPGYEPALIVDLNLIPHNIYLSLNGV
jgi:hypothetical protein